MSCRTSGLKELEGVIPPYIHHYISRRYAEHLALICSGEFQEVFLISRTLAEVVEALLTNGIDPYSAGVYLGRLRKGKPVFVPSTNVLQELYQVEGVLYNALVVAQEGLKPFLYGGDILRKSVVGCHPPLTKGEVVAVVGTDWNVYGLGISKIRGCDDLDTLKDLEEVAANLFDVGWYIRGEARRERKYKA
ncbi:MAG: hypothetical protein QXM76_02630 [Zestosphaera sp.]